MTRAPITMKIPHKIIITGTGRAGTTFLVRLLTRLGQPTGFDRDSWRSGYFEHSCAGLEHQPLDPGAPYIVKNPELCVALPGMLARGEMVVDHAIVPVRELSAAAQSRIRIGGASGEIPGGLVGTNDPARQQSVLAERFHQLVQALATYEVPHTFLLFPRFVQDADYAYRKLAPIFPDLRRDDFDAAFREIADPSMVHTFQSGTTPASSSSTTPIATEFRRRERRKRQWRLTRRIGRWCAATAALVFAFNLHRTTSASHAISPSVTASPATIPDDRGPTAPAYRLRSWSLLGARYRTRNLSYQPFKTLPPPPTPLCLQAPVNGTLTSLPVSTAAVLTAAASTP